MKLPNAKIHLWVFNHPFSNICDQVVFFVSSLRQHGYQVTIGLKPKKTALNVIIENLNNKSFRIVEEFCKSSNKKIAVIMTEHFDFICNELLIYGQPLFVENQYIPRQEIFSRLHCLLHLSPYIKSIFRLGDLPGLEGFSENIMNGIGIYSIPFPKIEFSHKNLDKPKINFDIIFTGKKTAFRSDVLNELKKRNFILLHNDKLVSRHIRNLNNHKARIIINIPQNSNWKWLSSMRIFAGLACKRATVSLGTNDDSIIAESCFQLDMDNFDWEENLRNLITDYRNCYKTAYENYNKMTKKFLEKSPFPHSFFKFWEITDNLPQQR
ncbi:hypothetical protein P0136_08075 [Lentisphaerota bacterium ZTH]|nr:hypothetical protein JYG24_00815 [Lentisphaerota bacterium]WET05320.1 hypothetical protein P0136_08075 [Lentisphaerota bacterium ZTH]